jgi:hypothetical protein
MEKSVKIALVGFLIVLAYATSVFLDTGFWIVPFPLFSYLLFGVVLGSIVQDRLNIKSYVPLLTLVTLRCIGNPFTYTFVLDEAAYYEFTEGLTLSLFRILETMSVFPLVILTVGFKGIQQKITALALCAVYILTLIPPLELLNYSFFTVFVLTLIYLKNKHLTFPALVLLAIFDLLEGYSVLFA